MSFLRIEVLKKRCTFKCWHTFDNKIILGFNNDHTRSQKIFTMKMMIRILQIIFLSSLLMSCTVKAIVAKEELVKPIEQKELIQNALKNGDWLVIRGVKGTDNLIASTTNMPFSHAAVYDLEHHAVIESDMTGVHVTPFEKFLSSSHRVMIVRPMWASDENAKVAVQNARDMIGKKYNFTGLVGINLPESYYCTQVAIESYRPFIKEQPPQNPIPRVISPGRMHHWGRVIYDTGP